MTEPDAPETVTPETVTPETPKTEQQRRDERLARAAHADTATYWREVAIYLGKPTHPSPNRYLRRVR